MKNKYGHLMSPIKVGNMVLKNRLISTTSMPHFLQGPESYPSQAIINHCANRAKNGAAIVTITGITSNYGLKEMPLPPTGGGDIAHFPSFNIYDPKCQNYFTQLVDAIHYYGAKVSMNLQFPIVPGYDVCANSEMNVMEFTQEIIDKMIDGYVEQAQVCKNLGFDSGSIQFSYGLPFAARFLSPNFNHRSDEYGGSLENRSKVVLEIFRRIKAKVGHNFLLEGVMSAEEDLGGYTLEEACRFLKMAEGLIDIVQIRMSDGNKSHPTGFMNEITPTLKYSEIFKSLGLKNMLIAPVGGFQDLQEAEEAIALGKADLIAAARAWICDFDYGRKIKESRGEDVVPCIRCNKCHVISQSSPYITGCSVNPKFGIEHVLDKVVTSPENSKKIAVVGGGVAGMKAALILNERGHKVTIFDKNSGLGGQLIPASEPEFKWPIKKLKNYLIEQIKKKDIQVCLDTIATPESIEKENFEVVIVAVGAEPIIPTINGINNTNVITAVDMFKNPSLVSGNVVVIGGGEIGIEAGLYLAKIGFNSTVLEMTDKLAKEADRPHYYEILNMEIKNTENFKTTINAKASKITSDGVIFSDTDGKEHKVYADTVIIAAGSKSLYDLALSFYDSAKEFYMIGDCNKVGSIMTAMRSAFATASNI